MEDSPLPTQAEILAQQKKKALLGVTTLCVLLGAGFLGSVVATCAWAVAALLWWGKPPGMAWLFGLALSIAIGANASAKPAAAKPDAYEWMIGKKDEVAAKAARSAAGGAPVERPPEPSSEAPPTPVAQGTYQVIEVKDGGTIRGIVRLSEDRPFWELPHWKDQMRGCGEKAPTERMVLGEDRALGNCLVFLRSVAKGKDWPEAMRSDDVTATIDQKGCNYAPHVQWVRVGTQMVVTNSDQAEHNIHGYRRGNTGDTQFNFASPPQVVKNDVDMAILKAPISYLVKCDIHPWMNAYVHAVSHPYHDVTSAKPTATRKAGEYVLENVPPGPYELWCWHEGMVETPLGNPAKPDSYTYSNPVEKYEKVEVRAGETKTQDFTVPAPPK